MPAIKTRVFSGVLAAAIVAASAAASAASPIVGLWSMTVHDSSGQAISVVWDEFDANGKFHVRLVTPAGTEDYYGVYRMIGANEVQSRFTDYEPKQMCTLVCSAVTPVFPMNRTGTSPVRFVGNSVMYLGTDRYNRQR